MEYTKDELIRYQRQVILPEIGENGQRKLKNARVLLVGAGGLGSPSAIYLACAGVGTIGIIDPDKVELSNLHRQVAHFTADIGKTKVESAKEKIQQLNPGVNVKTYEAKFSVKNAGETLKDFDFVIDGTDNFPTRYLINDACVFAGKPFIFGGVFRFEGQCSVFAAENGPCYRCLFEEPPSADEIPSCAEAGVMGVLPGIIGLIQSNEAIKLICKIGEPLIGRLLIFDGLTTRFREIKISKNPQCPVCSANRTIHELAEYNPVCQTGKRSIPEVTVQQLKQIMDKDNNEYCLIDCREEAEWKTKRIDGAILKPLSTMEENYKDLPKNKPVYIHCQIGGRSQKYAQFLKSKGYQNIFVVKGGMNAWETR